MPKIIHLMMALAVTLSLSEAYAFLPKSPVIERIDFAPTSTVKRFAQGSDNWPMTWGDDGHIYAAYGDGWGFQNIGSGAKIRLGVSRIDGTPDAPNGKDLTQLATWDQHIANIKATDIIMIEGILYLWSRRDGGTLRKSYDRGKSWHDTRVRMEQSNGDFHSLAFCQFGRNYEDARDDYVYVYGTSNESNDFGQIYLFKVLKTQLEDRSSYLFFSGFASDGSVIWTPNIDARQPVVLDTTAEEANDPRIVYNPGIDRYLLSYWFGRDGGIAILDAPEPWGPWTTVFYDPSWDHGFTFEYTFPRKWISSDGLTLYMAFSGIGSNDALVIRKANLVLAGMAGPTPNSPPGSPAPAPDTHKQQRPSNSGNGSSTDEEIRFIACSSFQYQRSSCPTGIHATAVELDEQISSAPCVQGTSWKFTGSEISVTDGCRAVFFVRGLAAGSLSTSKPAAGPPSNSTGQITSIACSSIDYKPHSCPTGITAAAIELDEQLSAAPCTHGTSWRFTASEILVTRGCRGVFTARGFK